ncbi:MAG TPA: GC-type dockerin domain-anchored protein [Phycisphaerales bacterium]|nr:GC-type dockerin domain-anchored protein [Phycisphaerales bacterium]
MCERLIWAAGAAACCAGGAVAQENPVRLDGGMQVSPVAIAPAVLRQGRAERVGEWVAYAGQGARGAELIFDCNEHTGDCDPEGYWHFEGAVGPATDDFTVESDTNIEDGIQRADFAWVWHCGGGSGAELCIIGLWTQESDPRDCEGDSGDYSGWLLDFGTLTCNAGGYYATNVELPWPIPTDGSGSYVFGFLDDENNWVTGGSQAFWGTGDARGDPDAPGTQGTQRLEDKNPIDGFHAVPTECYTYSFGRCPDPLGGALAFWGARGGDPCDAGDCDGNGVLDTRDFTCYLNLFVARDPAADCDGNGVVDTRDFVCFLGIWNSCR